MIKKIKITKNNKTILKDVEVELGNITIFAGENNSGKTQIINAIEEGLISDKKNSVIKIPAEKVILENEIKNTAKSDKFRQTLESLITIKLDAKTFLVSCGVDDIDKELPKLFNECNIENVELRVSKSSPKESSYIDACKEVYAKSIIESITIKDLLNKKEGIKLSEAGQGTERLVVVSLIRYLAEKKNDTEPKLQKYLIIEEPEIFLHPKLKRDFNNALKKLASDDGVKIILTTHDPYFISLNEEEKIYQVTRQNDGSTKFELCEINKKLDDICHSEINYQIFDVPTSEYALLLYYKLNESDIRNIFELHDKRKVSLRDFRNQLSHPTDILSDFDEKDSKGFSIIKPEDIKLEDNLREFIKTCLSLL